MNLTKKRWIVLAASCFVNICIGSIYSWSIFSAPAAARIYELTGSEVTQISLVFTVANGVGPITMISGGYFNDRLGPKWVVFIGGLMFGAGMIISGLAASFALLMVGYGLLCGLGMGMVYGCTVSNSVKFFPDRKGLAGGLTTASYGISSVIIPPIGNALISGLGISAAFIILGAVMLAVICVSAFFISKCPSGFRPEGWEGAGAAAGSAAVEKDWRRMLGSGVFYVMLLMLLCGAFSGLMAVSQASPIAQRMIGMPPAQAAVVVSVLALFNAAGRIVSGAVSDKIGYVRTFLLVFALAIAALLALYFCREGSAALFYLGISVTGVCFGSLMGVYPSFTAAQFGSKNNSVNYGIMFIGFALAGFFGPTIMSAVFERTGGYQVSFLIATALSAAGLLLTLLYRRMARRG